MDKIKTPIRRATITPSRRPNKDLTGKIAKHARHAGEIIWSWNILQDSLFQVFVCLLAEKNWDRAFDISHALWNTIQSDKTQREMVLAAAKAAYPEPCEIRDAIEWLISSANELSKHRNDAAHVPVKFAYALTDPEVPILVAGGDSGRRPSVERLHQKPTSEIWRDMRGDLLALAGYASFIGPHIRGGHHAQQPWPRKPPLKLVPEKPRPSNQKHRRRKNAKPPRPPKS